MPTPDPLDPSTLCARAPERRESSSRPLVPPIELSVVYCPDDPSHVDAIYEGRSEGFVYARDGHPNAAQLSQKLAKLEGAEAGLICASGMGAIAASLLTLLGQGDHLLLADGVYGKTSTLVARLLPKWGIAHDLFDPTNAAAARASCKPSTKAILVESLSNPLLRVADLPGLAKVASEAGVPLIVDNTFSPMICRPIELGADLVMHSVTKMIGGHSDLTLGALVGGRSQIQSMTATASTLGQTGNPFESWLALRGMSTLGLRMSRASATAMVIALRLEEHPAVRRVYYPLLPSHPDFSEAKRILGAGGGHMLTIDLGSRDGAEAFIRSVSPSIPFAPSLGDVQTTLSHPATTSHRNQDPEAMARQGIHPGLVRLSIGLEDPEDLWREFRAGVEAVGTWR